MTTLSHLERHTTKFCAGCHTRKPHADFSPDGRTPDGLTTECTTCRPPRAVSAPGERTLFARKRNALAAIAAAGASDAEITATKRLFRDTNRDLDTLEAIERTHGLTLRRWGRGLVCDCPVARPRGDADAECRSCHMPVVARLHHSVRNRAFQQWPEAAQQTVAPGEVHPRRLES